VLAAAPEGYAVVVGVGARTDPIHDVYELSCKSMVIIIGHNLACFPIAISGFAYHHSSFNELLAFCHRIFH
jgi:predicted molibdopterin-dependent oxidoreductase YjgC